MDLYGVSKATAQARDKGYVSLEGQQISDVKGFYKNVVGGRAGVTEYYMYDATNLRLREVSLSYSFPRKMGTENELSERPATFFCSPQPLFSVQESAFRSRSGTFYRQ